MPDVEFSLERYLDRVRLVRRPHIDVDGLTAVHRAQAFSVPFENFDIQLGRPLDLSPAGLFDKMVLRPRGGYCFELNGLLQVALVRLGFNLRRILARVHLLGSPSGRTHLLSAVGLGDREWIADVGFGAGGLRSPIPLELDREDHQDGRVFRLVHFPPFGRMLQLKEQGTWNNLYSFDDTHVCDADVAVANHFTETNSKSFFTYSRIASLPSAEGRIALQDFTLRQWQGTRCDESRLPADDNYLEALHDHFGIQLDARYANLRSIDPQANAEVARRRSFDGVSE